MKQKILLLFALLSFATISKAQDTEFWFVAPDISENTSCGPFDAPLILAISNATEMIGEATITLYNNGSPIIVTNSIPANGLWKYDISNVDKGRVENPRSQAGNVTKYGIHIKSTIPVTAYYQATAPCNQDIFALKGSSALGIEFYVPMVHDSYYHTTTAPVYLTPVPYDQIDIVASEDGTIVSVTPTKAIRVGTSSSSPAGTTYVKTLDKGQTLKIMEHVSESTAGSASLGGTKITSTKPIAVTTTEDLIGRSGTGWDLVGDQIVPKNKLGKAYVVIKGFLTSSDRAYMIATENGTYITVNSGTGVPTTSPLLNAGDRWMFDLGGGGSSNAAPQAVSIMANNNIYCYHISGVGGELGSGLMPSIYSIGQTQLSFYQYSGTPGHDSHYSFVVFRTGTHDKFSVKQETSSFSPLSVTPIAIPGNTDWQAAKIPLPASGQNKAITIKNSHSPFSLGFFSYSSYVGGASYGYLSAFGDFKFPHDTIYKCPDAATTLEGGYASSYTWQHSPTSATGPYTTLSEATPSITVSNEGYYRLEMDQDPKIVSDTIFVRNLDFQASIQSAVSPSDVTTTFSATINPLLATDPNLKISYLWEFEGGTPLTSTAATPTVTWNSANRAVKLTITGEANSPGSTGSCSTIVFKALPSDMDDCAHKFGPITSNFTLPGTTTYQWQSRDESSVTWVDITGATTNTYTPINQKRGITYYRLIVKDETVTTYSDPVKVRARSCKLPVNHNISVMGYYD